MLPCCLYVCVLHAAYTSARCMLPIRLRAACCLYVCEHRLLVRAPGRWLCCLASFTAATRKNALQCSCSAVVLHGGCENLLLLFQPRHCAAFLQQRLLCVPAILWVGNTNVCSRDQVQELTFSRCVLPFCRKKVRILSCIPQVACHMVFNKQQHVTKFAESPLSTPSLLPFPPLPPRTHTQPQPHIQPQPHRLHFPKRLLLSLHLHLRNGRKRPTLQPLFGVRMGLNAPAKRTWKMLAMK